MDFSSALSASWPVLLVCIVAIAAIGWMMKTSGAALRRSLDQLAAGQTQLTSRLGAMDEHLAGLAKQHSALTDRLAACEQAVQRVANAPATPAAQTSGQDAGTVDVSIESVQRFEAASQALAQLAQELGGFDARQTENWQRIRGDLEEQSFHLVRVQQHVDQLFGGGEPQSTPAQAAVAA